MLDNCFQSRQTMLKWIEGFELLEAGDIADSDYSMQPFPSFLDK